MTRNQEIAETILQQLGGSRRLVMMVGAYNFVAIQNGVSFKIKNPKANYIKITLNGKDLYDLEVGRIRGTTYKVVTEKNDLYFDMLKPAIEQATGMYLSLYKKGGKMKEPTIVRGFSDDEPYEYKKGGNITYKGVVITKEFPSGFYSFYSDKQGRFLKADSLQGIKSQIEKEMKMADGGMMAKGGAIGKYELMPYSKGVGDTYNAKYQDKQHFEGTKNDALDKANSMLSEEIGMIQVSLVNPKATNALNRTKKIATVTYENGGMMENGGEIESAAKMKADNPNWTNEKLLQEYKKNKVDLQNFNSGLLKPSKVIGGGYKSSAVAKKLAKKWLEDRIAEYKMALEIRGVMAEGGMMSEGGLVNSFDYSIGGL